ncbi:hypothetical protein FRC01_003896, partial [Tulasnella sp. 417]
KPVWDLLPGKDTRRASGSGHTQYHIETAAAPRGRAREEDDISYIDEVSDPFRDRSREPSFGRYDDGESYGYAQRGDYEALSHEAPSDRIGKAGRRTPSRSRPGSEGSSVPPLPDPETYSRYPGKAQRTKSAHHRQPSRTSFRSSKSLPPLPENASELRAMSTTTKTEEGDVPQRLFAGRRSDANQSLTGHIQRGGRPAYTQATSIAPSGVPSNADRRNAAATGPMRRLAELMTGTPRNRLAALRDAAAGKKSTQGGGGTTAQWTSAPPSEIVPESHPAANPPLFSLERIKSLTKKGKEKEGEKEKQRSEATSRAVRNPDRERRTRRAEVASWLPTEWVPSEMGSDLNANSPSTATAKPASQPPWKDDRRSASQHHSRTDSRAKLASVDESSEAHSPVIETGGSRYMSLNTPTAHRRTSSQQLSNASSGSPVHRRFSSQQLRMPPVPEIPIPPTATASPLPTPVTTLPAPVNIPPTPNTMVLEGEEHEVDDIPDIPSEAGEPHEDYSNVGYKGTSTEEKVKPPSSKSSPHEAHPSKPPSSKSSSHQAPPSYTTNPGSDDMPMGMTTFRLPERRPTEPLSYTDDKRRLMAQEEEQRRRNAGHEREPVPVVHVTAPSTKGSSDNQHRSAGGGTATNSRPPSSALPSRSPSRIIEEDELEYEELPEPASQQVLPTHVHHRSIDSSVGRAPSTARKSERDVYSGRTNRASEQGEHGSRGADLRHQPSNATSMMSRRSMPLRVANPTQTSTASSEVDSIPASLPRPAKEKIRSRSPSSIGDGELEKYILEEDEEELEEYEEERSEEEEFDHKARTVTETETATVKGLPRPRPPATASEAERSPSLPEMPMPAPIIVHVPSPQSTPKGPKSPKLAESSKGTPMPLMLSRMLSQRDRDDRSLHPKLIEWRSGPMEVQAALYGALAEEGNDMPAEERIIWFESTADVPEFEDFEEEVRASDLETELGKFAFSNTYDDKGGKGVIFMPATARDINEGADGASLETFWMNFEEAKATGDMRLVELIAEYDPEAEFIVFIYLIYPDDDPRIIEVCPILSSLDVVDRMWKKRWKAGHPMASELLKQEEYYKAVEHMKASV